MPLDVDVLIQLGETSSLLGSLNLAITAEVLVTALVEKYNGSGWTSMKSLGPYSSTLTGEEDKDLSDIGDFSYLPTSIGMYRWTLTVGVKDELGEYTYESSYVYFEVAAEGLLEQPLLSVGVHTDGTRRVTLTITESNEEATNKVYVRKQGEEFSDEPSFTKLGDGHETLTLGTGMYYAKVVSTKDSLMALGQKDPVYFAIYDIVSDSTEESSSGEVKNITNVNVEGITNAFFGNQFLSYFLRIPQVGYYQDYESRSLKSYLTDRINETIKGTQLPETSIPMIGLPYFGHQNEQYMGVGDGELGQITVRFLLDRYLQNYTALLNWSYLKYDWTFGGKNPDENFDDRDLQGFFMVEFLDAEESRTRKIGYKVIIDSLPGLNVAVDSPEQIEFETIFRVIDVDTSQFVMGSPLKNRVRIFGDLAPSQLSLT